MPSSPDFTVKVETAQTVVVRVLPTKADAILGVGEGPKRYCKDKKEQPDRYELTAERGVMAFSLGSQKAEAMPELTLLITDATTVADPFMQHSYGDADPPLADRDLHLHFPQLGTSNDRTTNWARQEQVGQLFVTAPRKIWVYATMDQTSNSSTIRKGEPLLLWELDNNIAEVLTLDGVPVRIRSAGLTTTAPASIGWPAEPHEVPTPGDSDLHRMLPPKDVPEARDQPLG
jgi:hypothetical protein